MIYLEDALEMWPGLKKLLKHIQEAVLLKSTYFGIPTWKLPLDAWVMQQIITEYKPDVIVELGTKFGGSTLMMAHWLDSLDHGRIITVDLYSAKIHELVRNHPKITIVTGDAVMVLPKIVNLIRQDEKVIVIEDTSHTAENTLNCLRAYGKLISVGGYYIVEDSIVNHGLDRSYDGPYDGIRKFLEENPHFQPDRTCEQYLITWNPFGYLKRIG
jgi:cephalosporin hydroxylase